MGDSETPGKPRGSEEVPLPRKGKGTRRLIGERRRFVAAERALRAADFSSLAKIRTGLELVARSVLEGKLSSYLARAFTGCAAQAIRSYDVESQIEERLRRASAGLTEDELADAIARWRRQQLEVAHAELRKTRSADGPS